MTISQDKALEKAIKYFAKSLVATAGNRLEAVDHLPDNYYSPDRINIEDFWIFYIKPERPTIIDGPVNVILVNKKTGKVG